MRAGRALKGRLRARGMHKGCRGLVLGWRRSRSLASGVGDGKRLFSARDDHEERERSRGLLRAGERERH